MWQRTKFIRRASRTAFGRSVGHLDKSLLPPYNRGRSHALPSHKTVSRSGRSASGSAAHPPNTPALKSTETLLSMLYPRTLRNVGAAIALATFAMLSTSTFAAPAAHAPSGHPAKAHASPAKHRHHGAVKKTSMKSATKASAHKKPHAGKAAHGKKKTVKAHHTLPPKTTHRARPTVASQRPPHSHSHSHSHA